MIGISWAGARSQSYRQRSNPKHNLFLPRDRATTQQLQESVKAVVASHKKRFAALGAHAASVDKRQTVTVLVVF